MTATLDTCITPLNNLIEDRLVNNQFKARLTGPPCAPFIAVLGGISAGRSIADSFDGLPSWWDGIAGPYKAVDTTCFQILSFDYIESTNKPPANDQLWPHIDTADQAQCLADAMKAFNIDKLENIIGASYGGMVALKFAELFPEKVENLTILCAAHKPNPLAKAWRIVQRHILEFALKHNDPEGGIALARELAMTTYRSADEFNTRFGEGAEPSLEAYLKARGEAYKTTTSLRRYGALSQSIDCHSVDPEKISTPTSLISFNSDLITPPADIKELHEKLPSSTLTTIETVFGHDGFLKEIQKLSDVLSTILLEKLELKL